MMFEEVRQKLIQAVVTSLADGYSTLPVNYPGRVIYDPTNNKDPFVVVNVRFNKTKQMGLGQRNVKLTGSLIVHYFYRPGTGYAQSTNFSDFLFNKLALRTISGIVLKELSPYNDARMAGWEDTMNTVPFQTEYFNS